MEPSIREQLVKLRINTPISSDCKFYYNSFSAHPLTVQFTRYIIVILICPINRWSWDFGDGSGSFESIKNPNIYIFTNNSVMS